MKIHILLHVTVLHTFVMELQPSPFLMGRLSHFTLLSLPYPPPFWTLDLHGLFFCSIVGQTFNIEKGGGGTSEKRPRLIYKWIIRGHDWNRTKIQFMVKLSQQFMTKVVVNINTAYTWRSLWVATKLGVGHGLGHGVGHGLSYGQFSENSF